MDCPQNEEFKTSLASDAIKHPTIPIGNLAGTRERRTRLKSSLDAILSKHAIITHEDEKVFEDIWTRLSLSVDWTQTYATIDEHCRRISQVFS